MTYRTRLILALVGGLAALPAGVRAAENSVRQQASLVPGSAQEISVQRAAALDAAPHDWAPTAPPAVSDVRFTRPELPAQAILATDIANAGSTKLASTPATTEYPIAQPHRLPAPTAPGGRASSSARIEITDTHGRSSSAPSKQPALLSALLAPVAEQQKEGQLASESTEAALPKNEPHSTSANANTGEPAQASQSSLSAAAKNSPAPDGLLSADQSVAQFLNDNYVVPANQEEPLPVAPNADPLRSADDENLKAYDTQPFKGDPCYDECCPPQPPLFWVAGVEATFLSPDINSTGRASWAVEDVLEDRDEVFTAEDVDSVYLTPRIWIGVQGCAWGANLRYWHLNASENQFDPSIGQAGTWDDFDCGRPNVGFFSMSRLEAYTIDLELTRRFCLHDCQMQGSIGVRHADVQFAESITGTALATDANLFGYAEAERYTRGTGLVFGLYGRKPVFPCSCVHWYYNVRWSALWGPTRTAVETGATVLAVGANAGSVNGAYTCVDDNLFIGEIQLGLEWNYALQCVPANAFFRAGVEYQRWTGGIGYSEAGSFAGVEVNNAFEQIGSTFASAAAPELDLVGLTLGTGLTW
jgi:hypothetical protein